MGNVLVSVEGESPSPPPRNSLPPSLLSSLLLYPLWVYVVIGLLLKYLYDKPWGMSGERKRAIARVQEKRNDRIRQTRSRLENDNEDITARRHAILDKDLESLRVSLQKEELSAVEVHEAYMWKALQVHERVNCLNEVIEESFDWAKDIDEKWRGKNGKPPLYGVPFSVKGNFHMVGYDCNLGLGKYAETPMTDECTMVSHLRALGAVPFVITTVPQALLSFVCSSSVYGTTLNPHDVTRGPGGSSGGEGALVSAGGTPFGIGSDLLGSLRIPSQMCGLTTLKPTEARFVVKGAHGGVPGKGRLGLGYGFFTKRVQEQVNLLKEIIGHPLYTNAVPESSRSRIEEEKTRTEKKMRIGYFEDDGYLRPVPSVVRAVRETVEKLKKDGHELVLFQVPRPQHAATLTFKNALPDGGTYSRFLYSNDVVDKWMKQFVTLLNLPRCIRVASSYLVGLVSPQLALVAQSSVKSLEDLRYTQELTDDYKAEFIKYWKSLGIDALVCPTFAITAVSHEFPSQLAPCGFATGLFNLVDFPSGTVPVGRVTKEDDEDIEDETKFPVGKNIILKLMRNACRKSVGLPVTVQVVGLPLEEEVCLSVMRRVEAVSNYDYKIGEHN